jgi:hypothetical protein
LLGKSLREFLGALFLTAQRGGQQAEDEHAGDVGGGLHAREVP